MKYLYTKTLVMEQMERIINGGSKLPILLVWDILRKL